MVDFLEAVTVSVGYGDFLNEVAKENAHLFDRWIVITSPSDEETRETCRKHSMDCILSDEGMENGSFNKGWLIERALQHTSSVGWRLHIDGDIVLPRKFRHLLDTARLEKDTIYGWDRLMVKSWEEWQKLKLSGWLETSHDYHNRLRFPEGFQVGTRWVDRDVGWCPIGHGQLWHSSNDQWKGIRARKYPARHNDACRSDVQQALQFDRKKRALIPEIIVAHLESEPAKLGANWKGRKTKRFGPPQNNEKNQSSPS
jgi:hypothetical protein